MSTYNRRDFLKLAATNAAVAGVLGAGALQLRADPLGLPIGCQTWPVRQRIAKDFPGTIKLLAGIGFQSVELCSPLGYADAGFADVGKYSGAQLKRLFRNAGVTCISSHFTIQELKKEQDRSIAWAKEVGLTQMIVPALSGPKHPTVDDVKRIADDFNGIAERAHRAGLQQGLHNEGFLDEKTVDGQNVYDLLFKFLDPKLVKFQYQVSSIEWGFHAVHYFRKYPGRFISMHAQGWDARTRKVVAIGQGTLNWKAIFEAAKVGGIKNYFVEVPLPLMRASMPYLHKLQV